MFLKKTLYNISIILLIMAGLSLAGCGSKGDALVKINDTIITSADFERRIQALPARYQELVMADKKKFLDEIIVDQLLYHAALKEKVDQGLEVKDVIDEARKKIIIAKFLKEKVDDSTSIEEVEIKEYYNAHLDEFRTPEIFRASHILTESETGAGEVLSELKKGKDFEELARLKSIDPTAEKGGDLGYFVRGQLYPDFEKAIFGLDEGDTSKVFKTKFGYHIVKVTEIKPADIEKFEDIKDRIGQKMSKTRRKARFNEMVENLRAKARIEIDEEMLAHVGEKGNE
ncbi:MAG: peptidyl-prolyl cis-trans isomerase [Candidatus Omnitrophica bacterium]|nr:peptidyl-prolyl cis-trans isomerase [Candidatus Omnitrophota bacterium]